MVSRRLVWADSLKGILIILVVLGHAIQVVLGHRYIIPKLSNLAGCCNPIHSQFSHNALYC